MSELEDKSSTRSSTATNDEEEMVPREMYNNMKERCDEMRHWFMSNLDIYTRSQLSLVEKSDQLTDLQMENMELRRENRKLKKQNELLLQQVSALEETIMTTDDIEHIVDLVKFGLSMIKSSVNETKKEQCESKDKNDNCKRADIKTAIMEKIVAAVEDVKNNVE